MPDTSRNLDEGHSASKEVENPADFSFRDVVNTTCSHIQDDKTHHPDRAAILT
jgi:hypothetical protein